MKTLPLRLVPGDDLRRALEAHVVGEADGSAFVVAGIGSFSRTTIRLAGAAEPIEIVGDVELLTLSGSIAEGRSHLHLSIADASGRVRGGHAAYGCIVRTTAEVLVAWSPEWRLARAHDAGTGFDELVVRSP